MKSPSSELELSYLINTSKPYPSIDKLHEGKEIYTELASVDYRIPAVWFMFFNEADLVEVENEHSSSEGDGSAQFLMPCTTKEKALENINSSFPFFVSLFGNKDIAEGYMQKTIDCFVQLDYEYLALDAFDYLIMNLEENEWFKFAACFKRDEQAGKYIKEFCGYIDGAVPYPIEEFYITLGLDDQDKINNSIALDPQFSNIGGRLKFPVEPRKPKPKPKYVNTNMFFWQGYGFLILVIPLLFLYLVAVVENNELISGYVPRGSIFVTGFISTGICYAVLGRWLNTRPGKLMLDPITKETIELRSKHSFLVVPMEYWSLVIVGLIILNLIQ
ncbi:MAG: hypothetical protein ACI9T7_002072 [Oleiphilaceae bacterium]